MGMSSLMVPCRCSRHYQRLQEILHSSFILFCFPSLYCSESSKEGEKKSQNTFFFYLPISFPPQNAHSRTIFYDTAISTHNFYLSSLSSTLHQAVLQGQQEAGVLFWKQWLWYRGSYNSWISCCFFYLTLTPHSENPSKCTAGTAEGWGLTPGKPLRHGYDQGLCGKGIHPTISYISNGEHE